MFGTFQQFLLHLLALAVPTGSTCSLLGSDARNVDTRNDAAERRPSVGIRDLTDKSFAEQDSVEDEVTRSKAADGSQSTPESTDEDQEQLRADSGLILDRGTRSAEVRNPKVPSDRDDVGSAPRFWHERQELGLRSFVSGSFTGIVAHRRNLIRALWRHAPPNTA